jgi:acyl-CoA thioester hydrolase
MNTPLIDSPTRTTFMYPFRVYIHDTDCYGVMWHGAYLKYLEQARDEVMKAVNLPLQVPSQGHVYPVIEQHARFKKSAQLHDDVMIYTQVHHRGPRIVFEQRLLRKEDDALLYEATTTCVVCDATMKPLRRIPEEIRIALNL